jgi:hypothetical protein
MSKQNTPSSALKQNFLGDWTENPLIEWLSANRQIILWGLLALFAFIILCYRWMASQTLKSETDFFQAQIDFSRFQDKTLKPAEWLSSQDDLQRLDTLMVAHPELQSKYDGLIAQALLIQNQADQSLPYAERSFDRTASDDIDLYHVYSKTSLLIGEGHYQEALAQAEQLKQKLDQQAVTKGNPLYLFNLIRLAMLHQQLNQTDNERQAWNELQQYASTVESLAIINQVFKEGGASLQSYIEERKHALIP